MSLCPLYDGSFCFVSFLLLLLFTLLLVLIQVFDFRIIISIFAFWSSWYLFRVYLYLSLSVCVSFLSIIPSILGTQYRIISIGYIHTYREIISQVNKHESHYFFRMILLWMFFFHVIVFCLFLCVCVCVWIHVIDWNYGEMRKKKMIDEKFENIQIKLIDCWSLLLFVFCFVFLPVDSSRYLQ